MFEKKHQDVIPRSQFAVRLLKSLGAVGAVIAVALIIGVAGYHYLAGLSWIDSILNASMILSGMGPANEIATNDGKLFASAYALFSGIVFISSTAVLLVPIVHRVMHLFHHGKEE